MDVDTARTIGLAQQTREEAEACALALSDDLLHEYARVGGAASEYAWEPSRGLAGWSGLALTSMAYFEAYGDPRFEALMHDQIRTAAALEDRPGPGLFAGVSGLRAVAALARRHDPGYVRLVAQCDAYVDATLAWSQRVDSVSDFDLITGWSGILLARAVESGEFAAGPLCDLLLWLCGDSSRWCLRHPRRPAGPPENDLGMAHGIAGVLAAIAAVPSAAIARWDAVADAAWILSNAASSDGSEAWWAPVMQARLPRAPQSSWCYGSAGIGIALYQIARKLGDAALERKALDTLEGLTSQEVIVRFSGQTCICHGIAGFALVLASAAAQTRSPALQSAADRATAALVTAHRQAGGRCISIAQTGERLSHLDQLNGIAGVALVLLTLAGKCDANWMRLYGLPTPYNWRALTGI